MAKIGHDAKVIEPLQNGPFGSKIKNAKNVRKRLYDHIRVVVCKKPLQKSLNIRKMRAFWNWPKLATIQRLLPLQNGQFGSKIKNAKNLRKTIVRIRAR